MQKPKRVESIPLFAQPLEKPGMVHRPAGRRVLTPGVTLAVLMTGICASLMLLPRPDAAQNVSAANGKNTAANSKKQIVVAENPATTKNVSGSAADTAARRPISFYTQEVRGSMFSAPQPPAPKPPPVEKAKPPVVVPPVIVSPFASWSYNATVTMGEEKMGLLENTQTKEGQWVHAGDNFMGAKVATITDQMITLTSAGKPTMLAKSDTINVTPLDRSASYLTPQQAQAPTAAQQLTQALSQVIGQATAGNARQSRGGPTIMLPNGQMLSGGRAQGYQQFMNQRFNGGGGGGGNGGGGRGTGGGRGGRAGRGGGG